MPCSIVGVFLWNRARVTEVVCECITVVWKYICLDTLAVFSVVSLAHDSNFCEAGLNVFTMNQSIGK